MVVVIVIILIVAILLNRGRKSRQSDPWTLARIQTAGSLENLLIIVREVHSIDFSTKETNAFVATADGLSVSEDGWASIFGVVRDDKSDLAMIARHRAKIIDV